MRLKNGNFFIALFIIYFYIIVDFLICLFFGEYYKIIFKIILVFQLVLVGFAISPIGEAINRFIYGSRKIITREQIEYLNPIFTSVYERVKKRKWWTSRNIKLYIDRSMGINAYAIGSNTIAVTRGAIETMSEDELKGLIAHEFGHLHNGDTLMMLVLLGGNIYMFITYFLTKIVKMILGACDIVTGGGGIFESIGNILLWACGMLTAPIVLFVKMIFLMKQRSNEYHADFFAYEVGYGDGLISALYMLDKLDFSDGKISILERLKMSHPYLDKRIATLESYNLKIIQ